MIEDLSGITRVEAAPKLILSTGSVDQYKEHASTQLDIIETRDEGEIVVYDSKDDCLCDNHESVNQMKKHEYDEKNELKIDDMSYCRVSSFKDDIEVKDEGEREITSDARENYDSMELLSIQDESHSNYQRHQDTIVVDAKSDPNVYEEDPLSCDKCIDHECSTKTVTFSDDNQVLTLIDEGDPLNCDKVINQEYFTKTVPSAEIIHFLAPINETDPLSCDKGNDHECSTKAVTLTEDIQVLVPNNQEDQIVHNEAQEKSSWIQSIFHAFGSHAQDVILLDPCFTQTLTELNKQLEVIQDKDFYTIWKGSNKVKKSKCMTASDSSTDPAPDAVTHSKFEFEKAIILDQCKSMEDITSVVSEESEDNSIDLSLSNSHEQMNPVISAESEDNSIDISVSNTHGYDYGIMRQFSDDVTLGFEELNKQLIAIINESRIKTRNLSKADEMNIRFEQEILEQLSYEVPVPAEKKWNKKKLKLFGKLFGKRK